MRPWARRSASREPASGSPRRTSLEHMRVLNGKLIQKIEELEAAVQSGASGSFGGAETPTSLTLLETLQSAAPVGVGFVDREFRTVGSTRRWRR